MLEMLVQAGLTEAQANVYLYLLEKGSAAPPLVAKQTQLTRTNAYKVLDTLEELGLVRQEETNKKITYTAEDPSALAALVAEERNRVIALEHSVKNAMQELRHTYRKSLPSQQRLMSRKGSDGIISTYKDQIEKDGDIYFVRSRTDIPFMGYETMRELRLAPSQHNMQRFGIVPDGEESPTNPDIDSRGNLIRTSIQSEDYTAPVEWTVSGNKLSAIVFDEDGYSVTIENPIIADSFRQLWKLIDKYARANSTYNTYKTKRAKRSI